MLKWALFFFLVSIVAGLLGFTGVAGASADIAKFIFVCFLVLCLIFIITGVIFVKS